MKGCPICQHRYGDVKDSENVCSIHQKWVVTICSECKETSFSDCVGFCMLHGRDKPRDVSQGSGDHRAVLRYYGLEDWN